MYKAKRAKRDTVENIYKQCQITGNCPPDVVNKVEQNTLADILLKIFGSVIYLGGLGIGSGSGAGSATGFRPIPESVPIPVPDVVPEVVPEGTDIPIVRPTRPSRPNTFGTRIDPIGTAGPRPRPVNPSAPAIVPLNEAGLPDPTIISSGAGPGTGISDFEVLTNVDIFEDINTVAGHPTVTHGQEEIAILDVTPLDPVLRRVAVENPRVDNAISIIESNVPAPSDINVFVDPNYSGIHVGEEIELTPINTIAEFEIEENIPRTSTPSRILETAVGRARQLYNRFVEQAPTRNPAFLGQPSRAILFEFENPAFSDDVTLTFERDLESLAAAPDPTFTDVIRLERPLFSETSEGLVRYSRLGARGKVSTRSGKILTQKVHFFYDISPVRPDPNSIELDVLHDSSDTFSIADELSSNTFVNPVFEDSISEENLIDVLEDAFNEGHLTLLTSEETDQTIVPLLITDITPKVFTPDYFSNYTIVNYSPEPLIPVTPDNTNITPLIQIDPFGPDFYLHPALMKSRKRKYLEVF